MREFRFSFDELLEFPVKRFWFLVNQVDRLKAEDNMRQLHVASSISNPENFESAIKALSEEIGQVYVWNEKVRGDIVISTKTKVDPVTGLDPQFDKEGLQALKSLGRL